MRPRYFRSASTALAAFLTLAAAAAIAAPPAGVTYQGLLKSDGVPPTGLYDFEFTLWDAATLGHQVGAVDTHTNVQVTEGIFTVVLNEFGEFGVNAFDGNARWIEITVGAHGGLMKLLTPRQPVKGAPYAHTALSTVGVDGHSLDAADGSPTDALFVDNDGMVGIGTSTPDHPLHVIDWTGEVAIVGENPSESNLGELGSERGGVYGEGSTAIKGISTSGTGKAIHGIASAIDGENNGVLGVSNSRAGHGVFGQATSTDGGIGVRGQAASTQSYGVWGHNTGNSGNAIGVFGSSASATGFGGYFDGKGYFSGNVGIGTSSITSPLTVAGIIEATTGGFKFPDGTTQTTAAIGGDTFWEAATNGIRYNDGYVGLGLVTNPSSALHVTNNQSSAVISVRNTYGGPGGNAITAEADGASSNVIFARNNANTGTSNGLYGMTYSPDGLAVQGRNMATTGDSVGVSGMTESTEGMAVYARATADTGTTYGVYAEVDSPNGYAGHFDGKGYFSGFVGFGTPPTCPVHAVRSGVAGPAVMGSVSGNSSTGVYGYASDPANSCWGVRGESDSPAGVGVRGKATSSTGTTAGVQGVSESQDGRGVEGINNDYGWAGYFQGMTYVSGNLGVGVEIPTAKLDVDGTIKTTGFQLTSSPTNGYVLTCNSSGTGTWQPAAGGLVLPYTGSHSDVDGNVFSITNTATTGNYTTGGLLPKQRAKRQGAEGVHRRQCWPEPAGRGRWYSRLRDLRPGRRQPGTGYLREEHELEPDHRGRQLRQR